MMVKMLDRIVKKTLSKSGWKKWCDRVESDRIKRELETNTNNNK